jgi:hypothetical protein
MAKQAETTEMIKMVALESLTFYKRTGEEECQTLLGNYWYQNEDKTGYSNTAMKGEFFNAPQSRVEGLVKSGYAEIAK